MQEVSIGRVITTVRGKGYGKQIMLAGIEAAREYFGATQIDLEAQEYAKGFMSRLASVSHRSHSFLTEFGISE